MTNATAPSSTDQLRQKAQDIRDNVVEMTGIAKDVACEKMSDLKQGAQVRYQQGVEQAGRARDGVIAYVKDNPGKSLLTCLAVGALAGFLISRRR